MVGRESNVFDLPECTYGALRNALQTRNPQQFLHTIEFYPQEGKYHYDGHAACKVVMSPEESARHKNLCPVCKKDLVLGVDHRVQAIADRAVGVATNKVPFKSVIPLYEIISECLGVSRASKKVMALYESMLEAGENEFNILLDLSADEIKKISNEMIAEAVMRMRAGKVSAQPGYDGVYGKITVFSADELKAQKPAQKALF
jgi:PHP family Zn ribbon phosphoesterase